MQTFVVRVWTSPAEPSDEEGELLRGVVEHVSTGRSTTFRHDQELLAFLRARRERADELGNGGAS